jgi:hypothetical protein
MGLKSVVVRSRAACEAGIVAAKILAIKNLSGSAKTPGSRSAGRLAANLLQFPALIRTSAPFRRVPIPQIAGGPNRLDTPGTTILKRRRTIPSVLGSGCAAGAQGNVEYSAIDYLENLPGIRRDRNRRALVAFRQRPPIKTLFPSIIAPRSGTVGSVIDYMWSQ